MDPFNHAVALMSGGKTVTLPEKQNTNLDIHIFVVIRQNGKHFAIVATRQGSLSINAHLVALRFVGFASTLQPKRQTVDFMLPKMCMSQRYDLLRYDWEFPITHKTQPESIGYHSNPVQKTAYLYVRTDIRDHTKIRDLFKKADPTALFGNAKPDMNNHSEFHFPMIAGEFEIPADWRGPKHPEMMYIEWRIKMTSTEAKAAAAAAKKPETKKPATVAGKKTAKTPSVAAEKKRGTAIKKKEEKKEEKKLSEDDDMI